MTNRSDTLQVKRGQAYFFGSVNKIQLTPELCWAFPGTQDYQLSILEHYIEKNLSVYTTLFTLSHLIWVIKTFRSCSVHMSMARAGHWAACQHYYEQLLVGLVHWQTQPCAQAERHLRVQHCTARRSLFSFGTLSPVTFHTDRPGSQTVHILRCPVLQGQRMTW